MKLAIVHCRIASGGALNVLKDLIKEELKTHPQISSKKIFTMYSEAKVIEIEGKEIEIITALPKRINNLFIICTSKKNIPGISRIFDYRNLMFFYPILMKRLSWKIKSYQPNYILISSFAIAKNIDQCKTNTKSKNPAYISLYLHSPMQYIRSHYDEYTHKLKGFKGRLFKSITPILRKRDLKYTKYDKIYTNSQYTAQEARKLYHIKSTVKYPKIKSEFLNEPIDNQSSEYYVCVGRLVRFVREVDTIIKLFNQTRKNLLIIGSGPDEVYLKSISGDTIMFLGQMESTKELISIVKKSRGLINITKESFGIGTAEALCLGVPVFGFNDGATPELVDHNSGILADNKTIHHLREKFELFEDTYRDKQLIAETARKKFQ